MRHGPFGSCAHRQLLGLVIALSGKGLAHLLTERIRARANGTNGAVPSAERPVRLADLARRQRELEVREEALILSAETEGLDRRGDAEPEVVLTVTLADEAA